VGKKEGRQVVVEEKWGEDEENKRGSRPLFFRRRRRHILATSGYMNFVTVHTPRLFCFSWWGSNDLVTKFFMVGIE